MWNRLVCYPRFLERLHAEHGDVASYRLPNGSCVVAYEPSLVADALAAEGELILQGSASIRSTLDYAPSHHMAPLGEALTTLPISVLAACYGEEHRWRTAAMRAAIEDGTDYFSGVMIERIAPALDAWQAGEVIRLHDSLMLLVSDVLATGMLGRDMKPPPDLWIRFRRAFIWELISNSLPMSSVIQLLPVRPLKRAAESLKFVDERILEAISRSRDPGWRGSDLVSRLVRWKGRDGGERPLPDRVIRDEICGAVGASLGPLTFLVSWCVEHLAWNPRARERLETEVDKVLGSGPIAESDYHRLPYARAVVEETLRLSPPSYFFDKRAAEDIVLGGYFVPRNTTIMVTAGMAQRRPESFDHPLRFKPERWLEQPGPKPRAPAYMPFGHGYRQCPGSPLVRPFGVNLVACLAQRWRLEPVSGRPAEPFFGPAGPFRIRGSYRVRVCERT